MSLFPRLFAQEFRPVIRLLNDPIFHAPSSSASVFRAAPSSCAGGLLGLNEVFSSQPRFDIHETNDAYILDGELPGVKDKSTLDLSFTDAQTLVLKGKFGNAVASSSTFADNAESFGTDSSSVSASTPGVATPAESSTSSVSSYKSPTVEPEEAAGEKTVAKTDETAATTVPEKQESTPQKRRLVSERYYGEFQRSFSFPTRVDQDAVKASLRDGILSIVIPKKEVTLRKINVE